MSAVCDDGAEIGLEDRRHLRRFRYGFQHVSRNSQPHLVMRNNLAPKTSGLQVFMNDQAAMRLVTEFNTASRSQGKRPA